MLCRIVAGRKMGARPMDVSQQGRPRCIHTMPPSPRQGTGPTPTQDAPTLRCAEPGSRGNRIFCSWSSESADKLGRSFSVGKLELLWQFGFVLVLARTYGMLDRFSNLDLLLPALSLSQTASALLCRPIGTGPSFHIHSLIPSIPLEPDHLAMTKLVFGYPF